MTSGILPHQLILERLEGELDIDPLQRDQVQPASVDLRLGTEFLEFDRVKNREYIDPFEEGEKYGQVVQTGDDPYVLQSQDFVLANTHEYVSLPDDVVGIVHGRSSWARLAIDHLNAGFIDPGFEGNITLEIVNFGPMPVKLDPGKRFCQLCFYEMEEATFRPYDGKYQGDEEPTPTKLEEDNE